jgi:thiosulfate/3-mercaptopyruvate sulfurtransferase
MSYTTLITAEDLAKYIGDSNLLIVDCRFDLTDPEDGRRSYNEAHLPQAVYAHLDEDLCGEIIPGKTGRHPLPKVESFVETLRNWGITSETQVVTYDDKGGGLAAGRLWWMLRWLGHDSVAVLNGGWQHWKANNMPIEQDLVKRTPQTFIPIVRPNLIVNAEQVIEMINDTDSAVFDSRIPERYRGEYEPIDPIAGHIPGAKLAPHPQVLDADGLFLPQKSLYEYYRNLLGEIPAEKTAFYCGSGVTAIQNIIALQHARLGEAKLYAGSWSEWITNPDLPIETG